MSDLDTLIAPRDLDSWEAALDDRASVAVPIVRALITEYRAAIKEISWMMYAQCGCLGGGGVPDDWVEYAPGLWRSNR